MCTNQLENRDKCVAEFKVVDYHWQGSEERLEREKKGENQLECGHRKKKMNTDKKGNRDE